MASSKPEEVKGAPPIFIPCRNLPSDGTDKQYTCRELCAAGERVSGYNSVIGAQRIGGLWRVYPSNNDSRMQLLLKGITIRGYTITPFDKNPYIVRTPNGETEVKTTKLIVGNLPISFSNEEIERRLTQLGCQLHSKIMMEKDRDDDGGLTRWLTGRRYVYIAVPERPLPAKVTIGSSAATVYHWEQKLSPENLTCTRCYQQGHRATTCPNQIVCRICKQSGHKSGECPIDEEGISDLDSNTDDAPPSAHLPSAQEAHSEGQQIAEGEPQLTFRPPASPQERASTPVGVNQQRGRSNTTQSRLSFKSRSDLEIKGLAAPQPNPMTAGRRLELNPPSRGSRQEVSSNRQSQQRTWSSLNE